jgi:phosphoribosylformimino-5-aminoimidazole carboxamide ribotide isomerase
MIAIPAVDLRAGRCVQLVGGDYAQERVRLDDPVEVARGWVRAGFARLHVVDLDAATGRGSNRALIGELLRAVARETGGAVPVQVGGGVREEEDIAALLDEGAAAVVVGTRAVEDEAWRETMALRYPGQLVLAADVRGRQVVTRGWSSTSTLEVGELVRDCAGLPLAALLVTAVQLEGRMEGTDLPLMEELAGQAAAPLLASGGVASADDLRALAHRGVAGAVLGMALYTGALDARHTAEEFGA